SCTNRMDKSGGRMQVYIGGCRTVPQQSMTIPGTGKMSIAHLLSTGNTPGIRIGKSGGSEVHDRGGAATPQQSMVLPVACNSIPHLLSARATIGSRTANPGRMQVYIRRSAPIPEESVCSDKVVSGAYLLTA